MADCCNELRSELAALRAEVAKLGKVDEQSIIDKAIKGAQTLLKPEIAGIAVVAAGAVKQSGIAKDLAGLASNTAYQSLSQSRSAALAADFAKRIAGGAVDLAETASIKSGQAFSSATAAGKVAQTAQTTATAAGSAANAASLSAKVAQTTATAASTAAAAASTFAASALGKALLALGQILTLAGSIAGLFALYGTLMVVFPRLDAHDRELDQVRTNIADAESNIFGIKQKIKIIDADIAHANALGEKALDEAYNANRKIQALTPKVDDVTNRVSQVEPKVDDVSNKVKILSPKLDDVTNRVSQVEPKVDDVTNKVKILSPKLDDVTNRVSQVEPKVDDVTNKVKIITPKVDEAQKTADYAFSTAATIKPIALDALQEAKEVRPISEEALAKTFVALNEIKVVKPIATDAFTATQLQATKLNATQLEVGKLGTVSRDHGNQIELNSSDINNLKTADKQIEKKIAAPPPPPPPATSQQDKMNDKALKDLQTQLNIAMTGIVGITALLKPIANNTTPAAIQNNAAAAVCRTAQPGGCMSNLVAPVANNAQSAASNSANNGVLLGAINALLNGIQTLFLKPILEGVQLINKNFSQFSDWIKLDRLLNILTFITSFHNAYMLSSGLTQTLFSLVDNGVRLIVPTAPDGKPFSASEQFGISINSLFNTLLGAETVNGIKKEWVKYNRIYQAGANIIGSFQNIMSSFQNTVDVIGSYTGKIGNSLKRFGVVGERAYGWMSENMNTRTRWLDQLEATIGTATEITSNADAVASNVLSIKDTVTQLRTQQTEFETALKAVEPTPKTDNAPVQAKNDTDKQQSQSATIALPDLDKPDQ